MAFHVILYKKFGIRIDLGFVGNTAIVIVVGEKIFKTIFIHLVKKLDIFFLRNFSGCNDLINQLVLSGSIFFDGILNVSLLGI